VNVLSSPEPGQLPQPEPVISVAGVAIGLVVMSSPRVANTARSTLAITYGTLSADQKPRSVSGDNVPPSTTNGIPRGAAGNRTRPAQRTGGAPSPPNKNLPQQYRGNYQDQECDQEDRVANVALGSASGHGLELDSPRPLLRARVPKQRFRPVPNRPNRSRPNDQS
jgi:hypothetical protein